MIDLTPALIKLFEDNSIELIPEDADDSDTKYPCVTYQEIENADDEMGDNIGYSSIAYRIQIWGYDVKQIAELSKQVDIIMKKCCFKRFMTGKQNINGLHRKILDYRKKVQEDY